MRLIKRERERERQRRTRRGSEMWIYSISKRGREEKQEVMIEERERLEDRGKEMWSGRREAQQILSGGEIALLRIYCFKCNWVQPAPGEKNPLKSPLLCGGEPDGRSAVAPSTALPAALCNGHAK